MAETVRIPIAGCRPPCANRSRLEERSENARKLRAGRNLKPEAPNYGLLYGDSEDDLNPVEEKYILNKSFNAVDFVRSRESGLKERRRFNTNYGFRHLLTNEMFRQHPVKLYNINTVLCSQWLSDRRVAFGTKCNKVIIVNKHHVVRQIII